MKAKEFLKKKGVRMLAVILAAAIILIAAGTALGGRAGFLTDAVNAVAAPVRRAATSMTGWLESLYGYLYKYDQLQADNESLKAQLAEAQAAARAGMEATEENERYRELLGLAEKHSDFVFESAKVVSRTASNWTSTFTISKGESSGIALGDCVVTEYGALIGQVSELGDTWATVRTVVDVDTSVGALAGYSNATGVVVGEFSLMQEGYAKLAYLTDTSNLAVGDTVLTSGKGGVVPQGLLIGTVTELRSEAGGQMIFGVVEPDCDLDAVSQVFIIKEFDVAE